MEAISNKCVFNICKDVNLSMLLFNRHKDKHIKKVKEWISKQLSICGRMLSKRKHQREWHYSHAALSTFLTHFLLKKFPSITAINRNCRAFNCWIATFCCSAHNFTKFILLNFEQTEGIAHLDFTDFFVCGLWHARFWQMYVICKTCCSRW